MHGYVLVILNNIILYSSINTNLYDDNARMDSKILLHGEEINSSNDDLILPHVLDKPCFYSTCETASHCCDIILLYYYVSCILWCAELWYINVRIKTLQRKGKYPSNQIANVYSNSSAQSCCVKFFFTLYTHILHVF